MEILQDGPGPRGRVLVDYPALAADSTGKIYFSDGGTNKTIYAAADFLTASATPTYTVLMEDNTMSNGLQGLVVDSANNVYVAGDRTADGNGSLRKFDAAGSLIWRVTPASGDGCGCSEQWERYHLQIHG